MFSVGQCIIISLAGTIYLAGAAFLLMGRPFIPIGTSERAKNPPAAVKRPPYFYPVAEQSPARRALTGTSLPAEEGSVRSSWGGPHLGHRPGGHERERGEVGLLVEPICLN